MTTPLATGVFPRIVELLEALEPPSRTAVAYRQAVDRDTPDDESADRLFWFVVRGSKATSQNGPTVTETEWRFELRVLLSETPHDIDSFAVAVANEATLIRRALETNTSFAVAGVLWTQVDDLSVEYAEKDSGAAVLIFSLRAFTQEDD